MNKFTAMSAKNIAQFLKMIAWVIFIGTCIKAGALLLNIGIAEWVQPLATANLYDGLNLQPLRQYNELYYWQIASSVLFVFVLQAIFGWYLIQLAQVLQIDEPFTQPVAKYLTKLGQTALVLSIAALLTNSMAKWLDKFVPVLATVKAHNPASAEILVLAAVLFVVAYIFQRGIALQQENDLTV